MRHGSDSAAYRNVFCSACIEIRRVPATERYCPTCGIEFPARPARQQESINRAVMRAVALAEQQGGGALNSIPGMNVPPRPPPAGGVVDEEAALLDAADMREETMLMLLQRLEESMVMLSGGREGLEGGEGGGAEGFFGGLGGQQPRGTPASIVDRLPRQILHKTSSALLSVQITAQAAQGQVEPLKMDAVLADFSSIPEDGLELGLAVADPLTAHEALKGDPGAIVDKAVLAKRGVATFASIALRAEGAGAKGTVVSNHVDVWPYTMKDSKGEIQAAGGLKHFVIMVPRTAGEALAEMAKSAGSVRLSLSVSALEEECIICQELYQEGEELIKLPCGHLFHEDCVKRWLKLQHTCPTCRHPLPVSKDGPILGPEQQRAREAATLERMFS